MTDQGPSPTSTKIREWFHFILTDFGGIKLNKNSADSSSRHEHGLVLLSGVRKIKNAPYHFKVSQTLRA